MIKTISDIAAIAGVAKSTVSRYLNGGSVSQATRQRIEQVIKEHHYVPNTFAQSLKARRTNIIGTVVPRLDSFATSQTLMGIDEELRSANFQMLISNTSQDMEREIEAIYDFARQKVSGIILLAAQVNEEHLKAAEEINIPILLVGQEHSQLYSLIHDDFHAGYKIGRHVLEMGHRQIAYLGVTEKDISVGIRRKEGFKMSLEGTECSVSYYETGFRMTDAMAAASQILDESTPSIIVCATDNIALGVMKAAYLRQIEIPSDLSVTGFGGYDVTEIIHPTLTTVRYFYKEAGQAAARSIIKLVRDEEMDQVTMLDTELLERESVDKR
ncbi:LacI family DNA-binding transcriptional regulator [Paenibacillus woosongensis]|uniref:LacI family DNA-binding transcriptional regulator n=1 Tax=Paenibacillus woosongensis TaxID=307580 RepID=A0AA95L0K6_9BACL|nr:LacI family DNA-binding transcriptional regulator [Paenibacillus woosongensis]WHX47036.1 LacI family DNA-binding transcriptional regulator [Paenibacillus woosongensis]